MLIPKFTLTGTTNTLSMLNINNLGCRIVLGTLQAYLESSDEEIKEQARLAIESITGGESLKNLQAK
jgi:hypothetical protein